MITCKCVKCEEENNDFKIIINNNNYNKSIHGGEDKFYLQFKGADHGVYRYTIELTYLR